MTEPKNPAPPKMSEWPKFRPMGKRRKGALDGRAPPKIADLIMERVAGTPAQKLAWLREQIAVGKLDGDDPEEIEQAEALLVMLGRVSSSPGGREKRHLDELLDEGLRDTFPASDPVSVGHFTSTEPPSRPVDWGPIDVSETRKTMARRTPGRRRRAA